MSAHGAPGEDVDALDRLAAEYVLGTLEGEARLLFGRLLERDEAVRALVTGWEARLQGLAEAVPRQPVPDGLRARVLEAVRRADAGTDASERRPRVPDDPVPGPLALPAERQVDIDLAHRREPGAALPASPVPATAPRRVIVQSRPAATVADDSGWRAAAIAASVIAASLLALLAGLLVGVPGREGDDVAVAASATELAPTAVSLLRDDEGRARYLVEIDAADSSVRLTALDADPVARDASLQLWMADGDSGELRAIGLLPPDPWSSLRLPAVPLIDNRPAFAVSREPAGGSPEAGPTGEVVFEGIVHPLGDAD